ncbi:MAG: hypothetical protein M3169_09485 [Candidatus Eremiobacteraeota bacterium]|nr:hypothetical protein [Candidatus Eremiobacteraeota bacterium]
MNVVAVVPSGRIPAWHGWCIEALRHEPRLSVRVVAVAGGTTRFPGGVAARLPGAALVPVDVALDGGDCEGADLVVDLTGAALTATAPHGVWSFRVGEDDDAALPFAREIAMGRRTCETVLEQRRGDGHAALRTGRFAVTRWYPTTLRIALAETARWPATLAAALAAGIDVPGIPSATAGGAPLTALERLRFAFSLVRRLGVAVAGLLDIAEWNVGFVDAEPARLLSDQPLDVRWLPRPNRRTFIADPFVAERGGLRALFVETFDYRDERGAIDALVLDDDDHVVRRSRVIDRATHLSYPYPVEIDGELYLIPENCAANEVALYRCIEFPDRWERETALFPAFDGVDTTLFAHEGRWWAFCTRFSRGSTLALNAFHADSPRGPWTPHALNPVVVDVSSARPAGQPFMVDGTLYRPAQDCGESYGGGLVIARIDELTPTAYREVVVQRHAAGGFGRWNSGIHTVSFSRGRIVVDGKHVYRDLRKLPGVARKVAAWAGQLLRGRRPATKATVA